MKGSIKQTLNSALRLVNLKLTSAHTGYLTGYDLAHDLNLILSEEAPTCLDIGANTGQTIELLRSCTDRARIYALEPSLETFEVLKKNYATAPDVHLIHAAAGSKKGELTFNNLANSQLSSFLEPAYFPWDDKQPSYESVPELVKVVTIDELVQEHNIDSIELLKSDTQGYELEVLRGAENCLKTGLIKHVLVEINFFEMYHQQANSSSIVSYLEQCGFHLIDMYEKARKPEHNASLSWCTGLYGRRDNNANCSIISPY